ncbi:solute carrier family 52, riboflavin transporter, member 3-B-like [Acanthaster planci]|uniref:Riboflavin transporter n=1 Tax=Acanthaster planci TaxID=133434 RepID=A0A8B7Y8L3_ACAPL|nr:solute carrier family 52, riboflavin transporter, member 3-B-like [Acanthaster planci]XP_022089568.1 solute carrier family 52, riboflavin transporter, member 3-B-like [Acanthaster planci]XP_022089569.1 solute carrier family 52, riboflavin transporter, member 3-B-like [Acanthaster planci]XP_022089570.1 solute carrier family 52, riboflavin transporter, member 3-B-like [Acanthaster planci]XP_022089571.1 solute carrier family 52, riboflavin transporter, member 3-B-like [Acanthaster planci]
MAEQEKSPLHVRVPVIVLVMLFGTGSWVAINGLWVQLPLLVSRNVPEGYNLAAYLTVIIQLANIGPLIFSLANCLSPKGLHVEIPANFIIVSIGCVSTLLLVFFWDYYTVWAIDGALHSTALLCLAFFLSVVDCTSSVAFTPFMSVLKNSYLTWYFIGEGLSSLLPSIVALIQGVGTKECIANNTYINETMIDGVAVNQTCTNWLQRDTPERFPPQNFFGFLFAMMTACLVSFTMLNYLPLAKREHVKKCRPETGEPKFEDAPVKGADSTTMLVLSVTSSGDDAASQRDIDVQPDGDQTTEGKVVRSQPPLSRRQFAYLFIILAFVTAMSNGALPSIQTYSCAPYGLNTYLIASTMANIANPLAAFLVMLLPSRSLPLVGVTMSAGALAAVFCFLTAGLSPAPPLQHEVAGDAIIILAWILVSGFFVYTKATIAWILRCQPDNRKLLIWYGGVTQIGSMIGAFVLFPIVTFTQLFVPYYENACDGRPICETIV